MAEFIFSITQELYGATVSITMQLTKSPVWGYSFKPHDY